jgi:hypothetical protein
MRPAAVRGGADLDALDETIFDAAIRTLLGERSPDEFADGITWGTVEENISVRWLETELDGTTTETSRLFKVPDSTLDLLAASYELLTGDAPNLRLADDPLLGTADTTISPEARR